MRPTSLVTGGAGFVGRHVARALLALGHDLFIVDDLSSGQSPKLWLGAGTTVRDGDAPHAEVFSVPQPGGATATVTFVHEDLLTALLGQLGKLPQRPTPWPMFTYAFHLASIVGGRKVIDGDPLHVGVDLAIDALFFRWVTHGGAKAERVLYASSSAAYPIDFQGQAKPSALRENMLDVSQGRLGQPDMSYGWSKMTGEYLAYLAAHHYGCKTVCVRPFSGYGEEQDTVYPIPAIAERVARGENPVTVWGSGKQARDFIHIDDCVRGMLLAIERIEDGSAVNLGTGILTDFLEVAATFLRLDGRQAPVVPLTLEPVGVQKRYCDPRKMQNVLGFVPSISVEEGFGRVLRAAHARLQQTASHASAASSAPTRHASGAAPQAAAALGAR